MTHNPTRVLVADDAVLYRKIKDRPSVRKLYTKQLIESGDLTQEAADAITLEFKSRLEETGGFLLAHWCGDSVCERTVQEETKATIRCLAFDQPDEKGRCVRCDGESTRRVHFARNLIEQTRLNMAEVAFTVAKEFQNKGLGKIFLRKLAVAAREHGISGLVACTAPHNRAMIDLFKSLPYKVTKTIEDDLVCMNCRFDELKEGL